MEFSLPALLGLSGAFAVFLIGTGFAAMSLTKVPPMAFRLARVCFVTSGILPAITVWYVATQFSMSLWARAGIAIGGALAVGWPIRLLLKLVDENEHAHSRSKEAKKVISRAAKLLRKNHHMRPLHAIREAGAAALSNEEIIRVNDAIASRNYGRPFNDTIPKDQYRSFLEFSVKQKLPLGSEPEIYVATVRFHAQSSGEEAPKSAASARPLVLAMDELRILRDEGHKLLGPYYVNDPTWPRPEATTLDEYKRKTKDCFRQQAFENLLTLNDLKLLDNVNLDDEFLEVKARFSDAGYLVNLSPGEEAVFDAMLSQVEAVKTLIALIEERESQRLGHGQALGVESPALGKRPIFIVLDTFAELIAEGDTMRSRLRTNRKPLPTDAEVKGWGDQLIELAGACANVEERAALQGHSRLIGFGEMIEDMLEAPKENWDRLKEIYGKLKVARKIVQRICREDSSALTMRPL